MRTKVITKDEYMNESRTSEEALELFKDWYLEQVAQDEWDQPLTKTVQLLASDEDLDDFTKDIKHYYMVHCINTWSDMEDEVNNYEADHGQSWPTLLQEYIVFHHDRIANTKIPV